MEQLEARALLADTALLGNLTDVNGTLFFAHRDAAHGVELWKADASGRTTLVKDINPGPRSSIPGNATAAPAALNGVLYFFANDGVHGTELWKSDGTEAGTVMVADVVPALGAGYTDAGQIDFLDYSIGSLRPAGGKLFFSAGTSPPNVQPLGRHELWVSDGTAAGTHVVPIAADTGTPQPNSLMPRAFKSAGDWLVVLGNDGNLYRTDGSPAGTVALGQVGAAFDFFWVVPTAVGSTLFFGGPTVGPAFGRDLWTSDGTPAGTARLKAFGGGTTNYTVKSLTAVGNQLFFTSGPGPYNNSELWRSDGTEAGTVRLAALDNSAGDVTGAGSVGFTNLVAAGDTLYCVSRNNQFGGGSVGSVVAGLWKSDGTPGGTVRIRDVIPPPSVPDQMQLTAAGGRVYFVAYHLDHGSELWGSDGTDAGTAMVRDYAAGTTDSFPTHLTASADGSLYFRTVDGRLRRWEDGANNWPAAGAGGPYSLDVGAPLRLAATSADDPDGDALSFTWDLNGDGVYGDATGAEAEVPWAAAQALGLGQAGEFAARVRADDGHGHATDSPPAPLTVGVFPPAAYFSGTPRGGDEHMTFTVTYVDGAGVDVSSLIGNSDAIIVTGPGDSFDRLAVQYVSIDNPTNGSLRTVTYRLRGPDGRWDGRDNGQYTVRHGALDATVRDVEGRRRSPYEAIGTFTANLRTGLPDLVTSFVSFSPARSVAGGVVKAVVGVRNSGDVATVGRFDVSLLVADRDGRRQQVGLSKPLNGRISVGQGRKFNLQFRLPSTLKAGTYAVEAEAYGGGDPEPDFSNNVATGPTIEVSQARLDPAVSVTPPAPLRRGRRGRATFLVVNNADPIVGLPLTIEAILSPTPEPPTGLGAVRLLSQNVPRFTLRAGASKKFPLRFGFSRNVLPGTYYLVVRITPIPTWDDADDANNSAVVPVTVV